MWKICVHIYILLKKSIDKNAYICEYLRFYYAQGSNPRLELST